LRGGTRRIFIMGPTGSGKSTLSVSASEFAGDSLPLEKRVLCKDVAVIQGDSEGMVGALAVGLDCPNIYDYSNVADYTAYERQLADDLKEIKELVRGGEVKYVIVDLGLPNTLLQSMIKPENQKAWGEIRYHGMMLYKRFSGLAGATIIANSQIKTSEAPGETIQAAAAANARATGGERSTYTADLCKGVVSMWSDNSSLTLSVDRRIDRATKQPKTNIYTQSNGKFEAKSRFGSVLKPVEPGSRTLHSILRQVYGEAL
jgi:energy-coupling factor transporter ATP-binding protein EcfA2